jgi:hypothetical protein
MNSFLFSDAPLYLYILTTQLKIGKKDENLDRWTVLSNIK